MPRKSKVKVTLYQRAPSLISLVVLLLGMEQERAFMS